MYVRKTDFNLQKCIIEPLMKYIEGNNIHNLIVIPILTGAMQLTVEILKHFNGIESNIDHYIYPIKVSSYVHNEQKGDIKIEYFNDIEFIKLYETLNDKIILIIDDIVDTGETIENIKKRISLLINDEKLIKIVTLIWKSNKSKIKPDYFCIDDKDDRWWVGYGMDDNGANRITNGLYYINKTADKFIKG